METDEDSSPTGRPSRSDDGGVSRRRTGAGGHRGDRYTTTQRRAGPNGDAGRAGDSGDRGIRGPDTGCTDADNEADRAMAGYHDAGTDGADTCTGRNRDARANLHTKADTGPVTRVFGDPATRSQRKHTATNLHTYTGSTRDSHVHNGPA